MAAACDGTHPETAQPCVLADHHRGYHKAADGTQWLDED
jgi:hypothetical protein